MKKSKNKKNYEHMMAGLAINHRSFSRTIFWDLIDFYVHFHDIWYNPRSIYQSINWRAMLELSKHFRTMAVHDRVTMQQKMRL